MENMKIGIIGLGRMGFAIAQRMQAAGYCALGYDPNIKIQKDAQKDGIQIYQEIDQLAAEADIIWLMVPAGKIVDEILQQIKKSLKKHTIIIDGGNCFFKDSMRRAQELALQGNHFLDCGVSGGIHGLHNGFCLMVGGNYDAYKVAHPILKAVAAVDGVNYIGPSGAGHYIKMIHNGIEYGLLQAYAEGFHLLREGTFKDLDLAKIAQLWNHGSVIRSWLLELSAHVFAQDQTLGAIDGKIEEGGTGAWTVQTAQENKIPTPVIQESVEVRAWSRKTGGNFATKYIQMIRHAFGGHKVIVKQQNEL